MLSNARQSPIIIIYTINASLWRFSTASSFFNASPLPFNFSLSPFIASRSPFNASVVPFDACCSIMPSRCLLPHPVTLERILLSLWCLPIAFNSSSAPLNAFSPSLNAYPSHFNASPLLFNAFPLPFTAFSSPCTAFHTTFYHTQSHLNASLLSFNALTLPFNASSSPFSTSLLPAAPLLVMPCNSLFKIPVSQCKVYIFTLSMLNH